MSIWPTKGTKLPPRVQLFELVVLIIWSGLVVICTRVLEDPEWYILQDTSHASVRVLRESGGWIQVGECVQNTSVVAVVWFLWCVWRRRGLPLGLVAGAVGLAAQLLVSDLVDLTVAEHRVRVYDHQSVFNSEEPNVLIPGGRHVGRLVANRLHSEDRLDRYWITVALGRIGHREVVPDLIDFLQDPNEDFGIRYEAFVALSRIGGCEARAALTDIRATFRKGEDYDLWEQLKFDRQL